ncbi:MAG: hypothetical protein M1481_01470, partial [Candidatus Thermoplasmatota archaeon]|nr:hypothetical protein [Candidatus Thermoplasmatota archaeon]
LIIDNEDLFKKVIKKLPVKVRALSIVNKISFIMYKLGLSVELSDSEGALMSMGNGFYSRFRKVHIKLLKVMKYLK